MKVTVNDKCYYMDGYLKDNMDAVKKAVTKRDLDFLLAMDGPEGSGKSWFGLQIAYYLDPTLTLDRVTFTPEEFAKAIDKAEKFQAVVFDEAFTGLSARGAMTKINRVLVSMVAQIRQKNLFVIVILPSFFDLDRNIALHRSRALIHVYFRENFMRGNFSLYNAYKKTALYMTGKKFYNYNKTRPNFYGRFTNFFVLDEQAYRKKKLDALEKACKKIKITDKKEENDESEQDNKKV